MVLSAEEERRYRGEVGGESGEGFAVAGEKDTAYTGPECPISLRELDGLSSDSSLLPAVGSSIKGEPSRDHTRM